MYTYLYIYICICTYTYIYYMNIYTHIYIYTHIHINNIRSRRRGIVAQPLQVSNQVNMLARGSAADTLGFSVGDRV